MITQTEHVFHSGSFPDQSLTSITYSDPDIPHKSTIIYFHGGGFLYGRNNDLPEEYISLFIENGFRIISCTYLLAPDYRIDQSFLSAKEQVDALLSDKDDKPYFIFGRSAGAYLALKLGSLHRDIFSGIIALYGYANFKDIAFQTPNKYYLAHQRIQDSTFQSIMAKRPLSVDDHPSRYLIYIYARQKGIWLDVLSQNNRALFDDLDLSKKELRQLPPTFLAIATDDRDVPFRHYKLTRKEIPDSELHLIESNVHDFDRTDIENLGLPLYRKMMNWLHKHL
ncbi:MAG: alpha/beta hydrolase [Saccharofermentanales bacterium]